MQIERRKEILNALLAQGTVKVSALAEQYGLNEATIRRDLKFLAQNNGVQLTYGGAYIEDHAAYPVAEMNLDAKRQQQYAQKQIIAAKAAALIKDGETIALNAGSTVEYILDYLPRYPFTKLNVITLSLNVALKAIALPFVTLYIPGGKIRQESTTLCGVDNECFLKKFHVDKLFYGAAAIHTKCGITHPVPEEVAVNQVLLSISDHVYLACDSTKFDAVSLVNVADFTAIDCVLTDDNLPLHYRQFFEINNVEVL